jgi:hypothetical protein
MLKIDLQWVTADHGKPDASDLCAAGFRRDRLRQGRIAKSVPRVAGPLQKPAHIGPLSQL